MKLERFLVALLVAGAVVAGAALLLQRQAASLLQAEIGLARDESREISRLQAENQKLSRALPTAEALTAMRSDHAAVLRLRSEIEKLKDNVQAREKTLAA